MLTMYVTEEERDLLVKLVVASGKRSKDGARKDSLRRVWAALHSAKERKDG